MLGSSSGAVAMLMGRGQISNLLLEIAGLDGAEIIKFLMSGDQNVQLRCAAAAFDVKNGLMSSRALVLDTTRHRRSTATDRSAWPPRPWTSRCGPIPRT